MALNIHKSRLLFPLVFAILSHFLCCYKSDAILPPYIQLSVESQPCEHLTSWNANNCEITSGNDIPPLKLILEGALGEESVSVGLKRYGQEYSFDKGYTDRDSTQGTPPYIVFAGLQANGNLVGSNFTLEFVSFFLGKVVRFNSPPFKILPAADSLEISLWGSSPELIDEGPWMAKATLPTITVSVMSGLGANRRITDSLMAQDAFFLTARLFDKISRIDISAASLRGTRQQQLLGGSAVFRGLSAWGVAGNGYTLSFFLVGTAKVCPPGTLVVICEEQSRHRSGGGGLGGYYVEMMSRDLTFLPDQLRFGFSRAPKTSPIFGRVGDVLDQIQVSFYDAATGVRRIINAAEGLAIQAFLVSEAGEDISAQCLTGTRVRVIDAGYAVFDDLAVQRTAGAAFTLRFVPTGAWRSTCVNRRLDTSPKCSPSTCCVNSPSFAVYPYALRLSPQVVISALEGGSLAPSPDGFRVVLVDSAGLALLRISQSAGYQVRAYLVQRELPVPSGVLSGASTRAVEGGAANFTGLSVAGLAGAGFRLRVQELVSKMVESSGVFPLYPSALVLTRELDALSDVLAGSLVGTSVVSLVGAGGQLLTSVTPEDNFTVVASARRLSGALTAATLSGMVAIAAASGKAIFNEMSVPRSAGRIAVNFTLARLGMPQLHIAANVRVFPHRLAFDDYLWGVSASFVAEAPILVNVTLLNTLGEILSEISPADNFTVQARLFLQGSEVPLAMRGAAEAVVDGGQAVFRLSVAGLVGSDFALRFELHSAELNFDGSQFSNYTRRFDIVPLGLSVQPATPDADSGAALPQIQVRMLGLAGGVLNASLDFSLEATLLTYSLLGCGVYNCDCTAQSGTWLQCAATAVRFNASRFAMTNGTCVLGPWIPAPLGRFPDISVGCNCVFDNYTADKCSTSALDGRYRPIGEAGMFALYDLVDATRFLAGKRVATVGHLRPAVATFSGLSVTGRFGQAAALLIFTANFSIVRLREASMDFSVDPARALLQGDLAGGPFNVTYLEGAFLAGALLELRDNSSGVSLPFFLAGATVMPAYMAQISLTHNGRNISWALNGGLTRQRILNRSILFSNFSVVDAAGSGFRLGFEILLSRNKTLKYQSMPFTVLPSRLFIENSSKFSSAAFSGRFPVFTVVCLGVNGTLLSEIGLDDNLYIIATLLKGGRDSSTLGTTRRLIVGGIAVFDDLSTLAAGFGFTMRFRLDSDSSAVMNMFVETHSPAFTLSPRFLTVAQGRKAFDYALDPIIVDRNGPPGIQLYGIQLQTLEGGPVQNLTSEDGIYIAVRVIQNNLDVTASFLTGTTLQSAAYDTPSGAHAFFDDLKFVRVGSNLTLLFSLAVRPGSFERLAEVTDSVGPIRSVPFALKIVESCYNGKVWNNSAMSTIDEDTRYSLDCTGSPQDLPSEHGPFGYLTGYYYFKENQYIGPLLRSVRNTSRLPPIHILATGLNHSQILTEIQPADAFYVEASVYVEDIDITGRLKGNKTRLINNGVAVFDDLVLQSVAECPTTCNVTLRFSFVGAFCSYCYCALVALSMAPAPITPPNLLGTHPAFPGSSIVYGNVTLEGVTLVQFQGAQPIFLAAMALAIGDQRIVSGDIHVKSAVETLTQGLAHRVFISFTVSPASYAVGTLAAAALPTAFRGGFTYYFTLACQAAGFWPYGPPLCSAVVPANGWTTPIRVFTAF